MKFGGTSVRDAEAMCRLTDIVARETRPRLVVVSALAGVTDMLVELGSGRELAAGSVTVFASTRPRPARRGRVSPGRGFDSRISPASTVTVRPGQVGTP